MGRASQQATEVTLLGSSRVARDLVAVEREAAGVEQKSPRIARDPRVSVRVARRSLAPAQPWEEKAVQEQLCNHRGWTLLRPLSIW